MALGATGSEDAWQKVAYISVESSSTVKMQYEAMTETLDIDVGEREMDVITLLNLGQIPKHGAAGLCTITFEGYPMQAGTSDASTGTAKGGLATGYWELFAQSGHADTSGELDLDYSNTLTRYRVAILWTNEDVTSGQASAASDVTPSITGTAATAGDHDGKMMYIRDGTGSGSRYMIVSGNGTSVYTLTTGDVPATDLGSATPSNNYYIYPTGSGALKATSKGKRFVLADCRCVSCKTSFTDGVLKQTLVFKGAMMAKDGTTPLAKMESNNASNQLPELGDYTPGSVRWA